MKRLFAVASVALCVSLTGFTVRERAPAPRAARHISLLIGVGNYQHVNSDAWKELHLANLEGPAKDVIAMKTVLRSRGFLPGEDQKVLVDGQARKQDILAAFQWVAGRATEPNDVVVIYYSGHGSWAPDQAIDATRKVDEALSVPGDIYDEGLVPWDAREPSNPRHLVLDDEIGAMLDRLRTENVTVIIDACFSGTVTRGDPEADPTAPVARGPKAPPHAPSLAASSGFMGAGRRMNHVLLTAALAHQKAFEIRIPKQRGRSGAFTNALVQAISGAGPHARFDEIMQTVGAIVTTGQTPDLQGEGSARLFKVGADVIVPARVYAITVPRGTRHVGIDVGAIHGVREGALYNIYGPGETSFAPNQWLRQAQIDTVYEASAVAKLLPGTRAIPAGARAVLSSVPRGATALDRLRLQVSPSAAALRDSLANIPWLQLTDRSPHAELRRVGEAYQVRVHGEVLPPLSSDINGRMTVSPPGAAPGFRGTAAALCAPLRRAYSIAAMELVSNDEPPAQLKLEVRVLPAGQAPPGSSRSVDTLRLNERYQIWARVSLPTENVPHSALYLSVAVAGYTSSPGVVWPAADTGAVPRLAPNRINQWIPLLRAPETVTPPAGIEYVSAVVNSDPFDFRQLVRDLPRCPLTRGGTTGRGGVDPDLAVTGWTAAHRRVLVLPPK